MFRGKLAGCVRRDGVQDVRCRIVVRRGLVVPNAVRRWHGRVEGRPQQQGRLRAVPARFVVLRRRGDQLHEQHLQSHQRCERPRRVPLMPRQRRVGGGLGLRRWLHLPRRVLRAVAKR